MAKTLTIPYEGKEYTLEFTRNTVRQMERSGFVASDIKNKPMDLLPQLFRGAFRANHSTAKVELIDEIFERQTHKMDLIEALAEMYNEPLEALIAEPEGEASGNVSWTKNW